MSSPDANPEHLLGVLERLTRILNERQVAYALIGGLGVAMRGPIRATRDIDLLLVLPQLQIAPVLEDLVRAGFQLNLAEAIQRWNRDHLLDFTYGPIRVDWLKTVLPSFERIVNRARWEQIDEHPVRVADAEGLILLKLIAFRPRDQEDIKGILAANADSLDLDWVRREWSGIAHEGDSRTEQFEQWVREFHQPQTST